jgi:hypothetical protein
MTLDRCSDLLEGKQWFMGNDPEIYALLGLQVQLEYACRYCMALMDFATYFSG